MIDNSRINVLGYFRIDLILLLDTILLYSILKTNRLFLTTIEFLDPQKVHWVQRASFSLLSQIISLLEKAKLALDKSKLDVTLLKI